jgi:hypothetical protein
MRLVTCRLATTERPAGCNKEPVADMQLEQAQLERNLGTNWKITDRERKKNSYTFLSDSFPRLPACSPADHVVTVPESTGVNGHHTWKNPLRSRLCYNHARTAQSNGKKVGKNIRFFPGQA